MALTIGKKLNVKAIFRTYKSNENTTDLTSQLLKTVTVNVLESKYDRKVSYEMANVVEDSGEGWFFEQPAGAMEAAQKVALEPLASALGVAAFLHNVIIVHP